MYKQLVIVTSSIINEEILNDMDYLILPSLDLISLYQGKINNEEIDFDYLIIDHKITKRLMSEDGYIITNNYFETSIDNYFAFGSCIKSDKTINEQLETIINYIKEN